MNVASSFLLGNWCNQLHKHSGITVNILLLFINLIRLLNPFNDNAKINM